MNSVFKIFLLLTIVNVLLTVPALAEDTSTEPLVTPSTTQVRSPEEKKLRQDQVKHEASDPGSLKRDTTQLKTEETTRKESIHEMVTAKKEEMRAAYEKKHEEFKLKVESLKDEKKKAIVDRID